MPRTESGSPGESLGRALSKSATGREVLMISVPRLTVMVMVLPTG